MTVKLEKKANEQYYMNGGSRTHTAIVNGKNFDAFILNIKDKQDFSNTFGIVQENKYNGQKQILCIESFEDDELCDKYLDKISFYSCLTFDSVSRIYYIDKREVINDDKRG